MLLKHAGLMRFERAAVVFHCQSCVSLSEAGGPCCMPPYRSSSGCGPGIWLCVAGTGAGILAVPAEWPGTHVEEAAHCSEHVQVIVVHCDICKSGQDARQVPKEGCLGRDELYVDQLCPSHILRHAADNVDSSRCRIFACIQVIAASVQFRMYLGGQGDATNRRPPRAIVVQHNLQEHTALSVECSARSASKTCGGIFLRANGMQHQVGSLQVQGGLPSWQRAPR